MSRELRIQIDRDQCISDGACWDICPEVFEMSPEDGKSQIADRFRAGDPGLGIVPAELRDCVESAAAECPAQIIYVEEAEI